MQKGGGRSGQLSCGQWAVGRCTVFLLMFSGHKTSMQAWAYVLSCSGHPQELVPWVLNSKLMGTVVFIPDEKAVKNHGF